MHGVTPHGRYVHDDCFLAGKQLLKEIEKAAQEALDKHERLLHLKVMELLLGAMVQRQGVRETRKLLLRYARDLREFHI